MDYIAFCKSYYQAVNIPLNCYKGQELIYSTIAETLSISPLKIYEFDSCNKNPEFCMFRSYSLYGRIEIEHTDYQIILGPAYNIPITSDIIRDYMHENAIPSATRELLTEIFMNIPTTSPAQFLFHLAFLHQCLNNIALDIVKHFGMSEDSILTQHKQLHLKKTIEDRDNSSFHNSFYYEQGLYEQIKSGDVEMLRKYLQNNVVVFHEGHMANNPLRQSKNIFIGSITKVAMLGAIPGGMDVEKAYQLVDLYVQECETLQTIDEINRLYYTMYIDFCSQVGENHAPNGLSQEVHQCLAYIRNHTNENISIEDVAMQIHRSSSYTIKHFKDELNINIGAFITRCKLEDAKSLLMYSDKSLAEISSYLCFSSQSYFQNLFKKKYGITPMQYRKQHHI